LDFSENPQILSYLLPLALEEHDSVNNQVKNDEGRFLGNFLYYMQKVPKVGEHKSLPTIKDNKGYTRIFWHMYLLTKIINKKIVRLVREKISTYVVIRRKAIALRNSP